MPFREHRHLFDRSHILRPSSKHPRSKRTPGVARTSLALSGGSVVRPQIIGLERAYFKVSRRERNDRLRRLDACRSGGEIRNLLRDPRNADRLRILEALPRSEEHPSELQSLMRI